MIEQINSISITELTAIIMAFSSLVILFISNRQTKIAERGLNLKINEVEDLAKKIQKEVEERERLYKLHEKETAERDRLYKLHQKEVNERILGEAEIQEGINRTNKTNSEIDYMNRLNDHYTKIEQININFYFWVIIRDLCILVDNNGEKNYYNDEFKEDLGKIAEYLQAKLQLEIRDQKTNEQFEENSKKFEEKKRKYNFDEMTSEKIQEIYDVLLKEHKDRIDEINAELDKDMEIIGNDFKKAREGLASVIERITKLIKEKTEKDNNPIDPTSD
jgi:hypothetical protein